MEGCAGSGFAGIRNSTGCSGRSPGQPPTCWAVRSSAGSRSAPRRIAAGFSWISARTEAAAGAPWSSVATGPRRRDIMRDLGHESWVMTHDHLTVAQTIAADCLAFGVRRVSRVLTRPYDEALRPLGHPGH